MKRTMILFAAAVLLVIGTGHPAQAQTAPVFPGAYLVGLCSATDYDAIAAQALGISPADLRVGLVSGQTLTDLAKTRSVPLETVTRALLEAHLAEVDQAVADGLLDKTQADQLKALIANLYATASTAPFPYGRSIRPIPLNVMVADVTAYNFLAVRIFPVAAAGVDMKCADLVKEVVRGRSIVTLVASRGAQVGAVIDGIIKGYQDALDQDVKDQLITTAQAKGLRVQLSERVAALVNQAGITMIVQTVNLSLWMPGFPYPPYPQPLAGQAGGTTGPGVPVTAVAPPPPLAATPAVGAPTGPIAATPPPTPSPSPN